MIKTIIQSILSKFGIKVVRIPYHVMPTMPFELFEYVVAKTCYEVGLAFRFIRIGANDIPVFDNFEALVRKYNITGCFVEATSDVLERLKSRYQDQTQLTFIKTFIGPAESTEEINKLQPNPRDSNDFSQGLGCKESENIKKCATDKNFADQFGVCSRDVRSLNELYEELKYQDLHLLYIDGNGSDDFIVYQALDAKIYPAIINYDWTKMDLARNYQLKMRLLDEGYRFLDVGCKSICVRQYF